MRSAVLLLLLASVLAAQPAAVEGTVVDAATHAPLPGVHIQMVSMTAGTSMPFPDEAYGAISGKDGRFSIGNIKPAAYILSTQKAGYIKAPGSADAGRGNSLALKPGEHRTDLNIEMTLKAIIQGRVMDENGDPVQHAQVSATSASAGGPQAAAGRMYGSTDERGQFRMTGAPGRYVVSAASPQNGMINMAPEVRSDGTQPPAYAVTWYPAVPDKAAASVVEAVSGRETTGIDIRLAVQRSVSLRGTVGGFPPNQGRPFVILWTESPAAQVRGERIAIVSPDGKFSFAALAAGNYSVEARLDNPDGPSMRSSAVPLRLDSDLTGMDIRLTAGEELRGVVEGIPGPAGKRTISLDPVYSSQNRMRFPADKPVSVEADGSFRIPNVFPGKSRVKITPLPEGTYVKTVRADTSESRDGTLDLSKGVAGVRVKILVSAGAGTIEGRILNADGTVAESPVLYALLAESPDDLNLGDLKPITGSATYSIKNIRPGKYRLFAMDPLQSGGEDFLKTQYEKAEPIVIKEGDRLTRDLKLPGKEGGPRVP